MRAVAYAAFGELPRVIEVTDPVAPDGGVVVRVTATGVCRSDWHGWQGHDADITTLPHVPGHELAGVVASVGSGVRRWSVGDRVTVPFVCACGDCETCAAGNHQICPNQWQPGFSGWGSFAEAVALPRADVNLVGIPDTVSDVAAAGLGCRTATAYRAVAQVGRCTAGEHVAVIGCGGVGLAAIMTARALGATVTAVDVSPGALSLAAELGADAMVLSSGLDPDEVAAAVVDVTEGGAHLSLDALGSTATAYSSVMSLRRRGRHVQVGLLPPAEVAGRESVPMLQVIVRELEVLGSHGLSAASYPDLLALGLDVERLVTRRISLDEAPTALAEVGQRAGVTVIEP